MVRSVVLMYASLTSMELRLLDLSHSALVAVALWDSIIATYGDLSKIDTIPWYV
jgi:hypothetical protein